MSWYSQVDRCWARTSRSWRIPWGQFLWWWTFCWWKEGELQEIGIQEDEFSSTVPSSFLQKVSWGSRKSQKHEPWREHVWWWVPEWWLSGCGGWGHTNHVYLQAGRGFWTSWKCQHFRGTRDSDSCLDHASFYSWFRMILYRSQILCPPVCDTIFLIFLYF